MSTSTPNRNRRPAGIPVGGQFAPDARRRSAVALAEPPVLDDETAAELLDQAAISSRFWAGRYGVNSDVADEAASRVTLATLKSLTDAHHQQHDASDDDLLVDASGRPAGGIEKLRAYVHRATMTQLLLELSDRTATPRQGNDARARRKFDEQANELIVELGRSLTPREEEELADRIRREFPENNRPHRDFYKPERSRLLRVGAGPDAAALMDASRADRHALRSPFTAIPVDDEPLPGSARAQAEEILAGGGRAAQLSARSFAWSLVAERTGAPHPVQASISEYTAAKIRKSVSGAGGAVAVARAIHSADPPPTEVQEALFRPFGELDDSQRAAVLDLINSHPGYGDDLWDASVLAATNLLARKK